MIAALVVHCKRARYDVYIGRPGPYGNEFVVGRDGTREVVIAKYEARVRSQPEFIARIRRELHGKVLGCWCAPLPCHGDVLVKITKERRASC